MALELSRFWIGFCRRRRRLSLRRGPEQVDVEQAKEAARRHADDRPPSLFVCALLECMNAVHGGQLDDTQTHETTNDAGELEGTHLAFSAGQQGMARESHRSEPCRRRKEKKKRM
jgi:hypothetical protein